jgi:4-hydroxythreonine-4-phosphate dehydrogenase
MSAAAPPNRVPTIAVTMGDPGGIGPEVIVKALADPALRVRAAWRLLGPVEAIGAAARRASITAFWTVASDGDWSRPLGGGKVAVVSGSGDLPSYPARDSREGGEISFRLVEDAIALAKRPAGDPVRTDAVVTGPISKRAWAMAGHTEFPGHTELFAARFGGGRHGMMFVSPRLRVILATAHLPLAAVPAALTTQKVLDAIELGAEACLRLGVARPRVAVCGLNPHAGEGGVLGDDEARAIVPAIRAAADRGIDAQGPFPGDTIFNAAVKGDWDLVVAMYHDQGLIPVKLLDRDRAVNVTVGLPVVRTSPDHGTAFDIAGQNKADPGSMAAALDLAIRLASAP